MATTTKPEVQKEKTVSIRIPLTKTEKDDVFVSVNNRTWQIKRGVNVEVPECVAEVLRNSEVMLEVAMQFEQKAAEKAKQ